MMDWVQRYQDWHNQKALPLWSGAGVDADRLGVFEALDHSGAPLADRVRRQRVQFRQAYVFARQSDAEHRALAWSIYRRWMAQGFDPETGAFSQHLSSQLKRLDQKHDLYDLSFVLLATSALARAGYDVDQDIARLSGALTRLRAPLGWYEDASHALPRRQNPHMHLFEASLSLYDITGDPQHRAWADTCLDLIGRHAMTRDGELYEYFDVDMVPLSGDDQQLEPGHIAEWIYLAKVYEQITGQSSGLPIKALWDSVLAARLPGGLLPNVSGGTARRLWPQTELLKAAMVYAPNDHTFIQATAEALFDGYLAPAAPGGWFDEFDEDGTLLSTDMPASTHYHIQVMLETAIGWQASQTDP